MGQGLGKAEQANVARKFFVTRSENSAVSIAIPNGHSAIYEKSPAG
jgi:hypothetical protein